MITNEFISNPPFPTFTQFETGTACNAKCRMCPHPKMTRKGTAKWSLIAKIIREAAPKSGSICPFLLQEPMLEPRLFSILANIKQNTPACQTVVYSNMGKLHPEIERIIKYELLDELHISFYGPTEELHKKWQQGLNYKQTVRNIKKIKRLKKKHTVTKPVTTLHILDVPEITALISSYPLLRDVDQSTLVQYDTFHGDVPDYGGQQFAKIVGAPAERTPCQRLWTGLNIHFDGSVVPCCIDWRDQNVLGNVTGQTLKEVWESPKFQQFRKLHVEGKWDTIPMCRDCKVHEYQTNKEWTEYWKKQLVTLTC